MDGELDGAVYNEAERRVDRLARHQHGVFSRAQAIEAGFEQAGIHRRIGAGLWIRLDPAVYALPSHPFTWERSAMAAVLSIPGALASGRTAAALHGLDGFRPGPLHVVVPPGSNERSRLAKVHRSAFVDPDRVNGIPCLTVAHTLLDLAASLGPDHLADVIDRCLTSHQVAFAELSDRFVRHAAGRRPGTRALREILTARSIDDPEPTMTELERLLRRMLAAPGLPPFAFEVEMPWWPAGQGRVDGFAGSCALITEADGRRWHTRERDFVNDRRRDNLAVANGHAVLRFTYGDLTRSVGECRDLVRQTARERGWLASVA